MAIVLLLNNTQVYPDGSQTIKLTRENPYFTQSESYTLEVSLPMGVLANRRFFQNIHRQERSKQLQNYTCRLLVDNHPVLYGTATVTRITDDAVKVQLLGGNSEVNFLSEENNVYIDTLDLGTYPSRPNVRNGFTETVVDGIHVMPTIVYDETSEKEFVTIQPRLVDVAEKIIALSGYQLLENYTNREPWNRIYVANAKTTRSIADTLPHWLTKEFFAEFCQFFNVTIVLDQLKRTAKILSNITFFGDAAGHLEELEPVEEYTVEISSDEQSSEVKSLANDNLEFDLSASEHHAQDCFSDAEREALPRKTFGNYQLLQASWETTSANLRKRFLYACPTGVFASWFYDFSLIENGSDETEVLERLDHLAPLIRSEAEGASSRSLKIVPVAIGRWTDHIEDVGAQYDLWWQLPSMESPTGQGWRSDSSRRGGSIETEEDVPEDTIQECVEAGSTSSEKAEKEDRLQVMFMDEAQTLYRAEESSVRGQSQSSGIIGFTDWQYKMNPVAGQHAHWSLSLNPTYADYYLGQLHQNGFSFNMKAKNIFKFLAEQMPDPMHIFLVRGHRYACEKIEAKVNADGFERLMTGYFYEML